LPCSTLKPCTAGAFNTTTGPVAWELLLRARAADNQLYVLGCSPARPSQADIDGGSYPTWGHSSGVDPWGKVLATCDAAPARVRVELDPEMVEKCRAGVPISTQRECKSKPD
jgi:predicted amidohydrolase